MSSFITSHLDIINLDAISGIQSAKAAIAEFMN